MRLRNKKTGEIKDWDFGNWYQTILNPENKEKYECKLNDFIDRAVKFREEWKDYEEPKEFWYINEFGTPTKADFVGRETLYDKCRKNFGNYFESEGEAEKAVEKLKALTEAKEDGLKIKGYYYNHEDLVILADIGKCNKLTLDTLFGKEID